jgi:hypothetical protein
VILPALKIASLKQMSDQTQEAVIMDFLSQDGKSDSMINSVEASFYVSIDEPSAVIPGLLAGTQRCVATSSRAKSMGMVTALAIVVSIQNLSDDLLEQLV